MPLPRLHLLLLTSPTMSPLNVLIALSLLRLLNACCRLLSCCHAIFAPPFLLLLTLVDLMVTLLPPALLRLTPLTRHEPAPLPALITLTNILLFASLLSYHTTLHTLIHTAQPRRARTGCLEHPLYTCALKRLARVRTRAYVSRLPLAHATLAHHSHTLIWFTPHTHTR